MTYISDKSRYNYSSEPHEPTYAIGWLDGAHKFPKGKVSEAFITRLKDFLETPTNLTRGHHLCNLPEELGDTYYPAFSDTKFEDFRRMKDEILYPHSNGEIHVLGKFGELYAAPVMIYHYITNFCYKPPQEFIDAIMNTPKGEENPYECGKLDPNFVPSKTIEVPANTYYKKAIEFFDDGDTEAGIEAIEEAIKLDPFNNDFKFEYGYMLLEMHKNEEALSIFRGLVDQVDYKYLVYGNMGILLERLKEYKEALNCCNFYMENVEDITGMDEILVTRGKIYLGLEEKKKAMKDFKASLDVPNADEETLAIAKKYLEEMKSSNSILGLFRRG